MLGLMNQEPSSNIQLSVKGVSPTLPLVIFSVVRIEFCGAALLCSALRKNRTSSYNYFPCYLNRKR